MQPSYLINQNIILKINTMRKTNINIEVALDENHVPEKITWNAEDGGVERQET